MADINHVISLGIGSPAALLQFFTFGLKQAVIPKLDVAATDALVYCLALTNALAGNVALSDAVVGNVALSDATRA